MSTPLAVESALTALLRGIPGLSDVVGDRISPLSSIQDIDRPHLTYRLVRTETVDHLKGSSGLFKVTFQVDCWSKDETANKQVALIFRDAFANGGKQTVGGYDIKWVWFFDEADSYQSLSVEAAELGLCRTSCQLRFWYSKVN